MFIDAQSVQLCFNQPRYELIDTLSILCRCLFDQFLLAFGQSYGNAVKVCSIPLPVSLFLGISILSHPSHPFLIYYILPHSASLNKCTFYTTGALNNLCIIPSCVHLISVLPFSHRQGTASREKVEGSRPPYAERPENPCPYPSDPVPPVHDWKMIWRLAASC